METCRHSLCHKIIPRNIFSVFGANDFCLSQAGFLARFVQINPGSDMNRIKPHRIIMFVCVVALIGIAIYNVQRRGEKQQAQAAAEVKQKADAEAAKVKAIQDAAVEHERFITKYVNIGIAKKTGNQMVAVAVASETGSMNHAIGSALVSRFKTDHVQLTDSFFKPELVTDGLFLKTFNGATDLFNKLELAKSLDALLLARQIVQYETNADLNNVITVNMSLEVTTLPVTGQIQSQSWTFTANGSGFRRGEARMQAEERIIKQLESNTNMSLGF